MTKAPPRVVLDTNVVVSALILSRGPTSRLRTAWQADRFVPLASATTAQELLRVLAYPKFNLAATVQHDLLADFLPWVEVVEMPDPLPSVPRCRDPFDLPFLHLAIAGRASALVSGDRDLLVLARSPRLCPVLTPDAFCHQYRLE